MKKLILLTLLVAGSTGWLCAQYVKGDKVLGAGLSFSASSTDAKSNPSSTYKSSSSSGGVSVDLGIAGRVNRLGGIYLYASAGSSKSEYNTQPSFNTQSDFYSLGSGFFSRRYRSLGKGFFLFAEGRAEFYYSRNNTDNSPYTKRTSLGLSAGLFPGLSYQAGKRFMLDLRFADFVSLNYDRMVNTTASGTKDKTSNFGFSSSLGLGYLQNMGIGARWILPAGKK